MLAMLEATSDKTLVHNLPLLARDHVLSSGVGGQLVLIDLADDLAAVWHSCARQKLYCVECLPPTLAETPDDGAQLSVAATYPGYLDHQWIQNPRFARWFQSQHWQSGSVS